jgi:hypothetical protein
LLSKKHKKLHQMMLPLSHKLMPQLLLSARRIRLLLPEKIKSEMKLKSQETQEDGDSFGQSTLLPKKMITQDHTI